MRAKRLIWIFLVIQLLFTPFSQLNHNTSSRFAAMDAFCATGSFEISPYLSETDDWAKTPDGKHYSNKAPGTLFIAAPFYCAALSIQRAILPRPKDQTEQVRNEWKLRFVLNFALCFLLQILPWIWICTIWGDKLEELGASSGGRQFAWVALLFGTTPAVLMDVWIGHPIVALFSLLALLAALERRAVLFGFALGMMQLTEYSSLLLFPAALLAFCAGRPAALRELPRTILRMAAGAALPAILWILYHQSAFGSPFVIANRFQNPMFQDTLSNSVQLWGIFTLPDPLVFAKLLFGWWRGILFSQPWVLVALALTPRLLCTDSAKRASLYGTAGLILLLIMNASFGSWHGGSAAGPRYLSAALPIFAIPIALCWDRLSAFQHRLLWGSLGFSCLVFFLAKIFSPTAGLWPEWILYFLEKPFDFGWKGAFEILVIVLLVYVIPNKEGANT